MKWTNSLKDTLWCFETSFNGGKPATPTSNSLIRQEGFNSVQFNSDIIYPKVPSDSMDKGSSLTRLPPPPPSDTSYKPRLLPVLLTDWL